VATERFETFREGVQIAEAILFLQRALQSKSIGGELAQQVDRYLDERGQAYLREWWSGWPARDERLFELAQKVARNRFRESQAEVRP